MRSRTLHLPLFRTTLPFKWTPCTDPQCDVSICLTWGVFHDCVNLDTQTLLLAQNATPSDESTTTLSSSRTNFGTCAHSTLKSTLQPRPYRFRLSSSQWLTGSSPSSPRSPKVSRRQRSSRALRPRRNWTRSNGCSWRRTLTSWV